MAQVTLPDQAYQTLAQLAQLHPGVTPEAYISAVIAGQIDITADIDQLDQLAFWGTDNDAILDEAEVELAQREPRYLTEDELFQELDANAKSIKGVSDADV